MISFCERIVNLGLLLTIASSYEFFRDEIPNGLEVPHPCNPIQYWDAVGHVVDKGGGSRNRFGEDFMKEGKKWTVNLCLKDSDGDGLTNGQELGDPECKWTKGTKVNSPRTANISHPGICEPLTSVKCLSQRDLCKSFECDALNETDVREVTIRLTPEVPVPAKHTTYMCQVFRFEDLTPPGDYHLVAVKPVLNNADVIHHMVLFGCPDHNLDMKPFECDMVPSAKCQSFLSIWTIGLKGECLHPETGIRLGGTEGIKYLALQVHWNNPENITTWTDNSGLKLYITQKKRRHNAAIFTTGRQDFILPARTSSIVLESNCTSGCTRTKLRGPIYITSAFNHMHRAGVKMSILIKYANKTTKYLTKDDNYNYDSPQVFYYTDRPVKLEPGDEILTKCEFNTSARNSSTRWGQATADEMCYGFITYFPKENFTSDFCLGVGPEFMYCEPSTLRGCYRLRNHTYGSYLSNTELYRQVTDNCGRDHGNCHSECNQTITQLKQNDVCLRDEVFDFLMEHLWRKSREGNQLIGWFKSCDGQSNAIPVMGFLCCNVFWLCALLPSAIRLIL
ncbi:DBH-like monooxygenase protein 2 [Bulinus truncatus]|nr:DBH-like monooxygenase protein 2 [Bulinus truncatus]